MDKKASVDLILRAGLCTVMVALAPLWGGTNVTCIPGARGQGIGAAITLAPSLAAREMGYRIGILHASELGARVYRRLGFQDFGKRSIFLWENDLEVLRE